MGIPAILIGYKVEAVAADREPFSFAAKRQYQYLRRRAPRSVKTGAISDDEDKVLFRAVSVFAVPVFVAFYGLSVGKRAIINRGLAIWTAYKRHLTSPSQNLWMDTSCTTC